MAKFDFEEDRKRGTRFAERAGLDPATTSIDFSFERVSRADPGKEVLVKMTTSLFLSTGEFSELYCAKEPV